MWVGVLMTICKFSESSSDKTYEVRPDPNLQHEKTVEITCRYVRTRSSQYVLTLYAYVCVLCFHHVRTMHTTRSMHIYSTRVVILLLCIQQYAYSRRVGGSIYYEYNTICQSYELDQEFLLLLLVVLARSYLYNSTRRSVALTLEEWEREQTSKTKTFQNYRLWQLPPYTDSPPASPPTSPP